MIGSLLAALAVAYAAVLALAYAFQPHLIYFPARELGADPSTIGLGYEEIGIETQDNLRLHGWFVPARQARATLLSCTATPATFPIGSTRSGSFTASASMC